MSRKTRHMLIFIKDIRRFFVGGHLAENTPEDFIIPFRMHPKSVSR